MAALVLVSGFGGPGFEWRLSPIRNRAEAHGWKPIYHQRRLQFGPVDRSGDRLIELIDALGAAERVVLVGHSMGGLVAAYAAQRRPVDALVTLGTPHRGVPMAVVPWAGIPQMRSGCRFLRELTTDVPTLAVGARGDELVWGERAYPLWAHQRLDAGDIGHLNLIRSNSVATTIFGWLESIRPVGWFPEHGAA